MPIIAKSLIVHERKKVAIQGRIKDIILPGESSESGEDSTVAGGTNLNNNDDTVSSSAQSSSTQKNQSKDSKAPNDTTLTLDGWRELWSPYVFSQFTVSGNDSELPLVKRPPVRIIIEGMNGGILEAVTCLNMAINEGVSILLLYFL